MTIELQMAPLVCVCVLCTTKPSPLVHTLDDGLQKYLLSSRGAEGEGKRNTCTESVIFPFGYITTVIKIKKKNLRRWIDGNEFCELCPLLISMLFVRVFLVFS
jgi:hypothetical protein